MWLSLDSAKPRDIYSWMVHLITPRPIAWVSTLSKEGIANLAPYSFFNGVGSNPPSLLFCPANRRDGSPKDTLANVEATGEFVVNIVTEDLAGPMNQSSAECYAEIDEFELCQLQSAASKRVRVPRVERAVAAFECELMQTIHLGHGPGGANVVIGRIVEIFFDDSLLDANGIPVLTQLETIGRLGGESYVRTTDRFTLPRPSP